jgi:hypothetical protein
MKILLLLAASLLLASAAARADMTGGTVTLIGPGMALPGTEVTFIFEVTNGSSDGEASSAVHFRFPETFRVLEGWYDDRGQGWSLAMAPYGDYTERVIFYDPDDEPSSGEILPGQSGDFYVRVAISSNTECNVYEFDWKQYGDNTGKHPHYVIGTLPYDICGVAVESSSFSSVKRLY